MAGVPGIPLTGFGLIGVLAYVYGVPWAVRYVRGKVIQAHIRSLTRNVQGLRRVVNWQKEGVAQLIKEGASPEEIAHLQAQIAANEAEIDQLFNLIIDLGESL
jgi:hypothetical protein